MPQSDRLRRPIACISFLHYECAISYHYGADDVFAIDYDSSCDYDREVIYVEVRFFALPGSYDPLHDCLRHSVQVSGSGIMLLVTIMTFT